jgi:hypothetical protein
LVLILSHKYIGLFPSNPNKNLSILVLILLILQSTEKKRNYKRNVLFNRVFVRLDFLQEIFAFSSDAEFKTDFRMSKQAFIILSDLLTPPSLQIQKKYLTSFDIPVNVKVAIALRYFAGGQVADISVKHGISKSICKYIITLVITSILTCKNIGPFIFKANDEIWLQ